MDNKELNRYRSILKENRRILKKELERLADEEDLSLKESIDELSSYDNHPADDATETYERGLDRGLRDNTITILKKIEDALSKIEAGKYGVCQNCGKEISKDRLEAVPYASFCKHCQEEAEELEGVMERPLEETSFYPPFRGFNDNTDNVGYDAEDAWQDVAQYGTSNPPEYVAEDILTGERLKKEAYVDANEIIGAVGIEDTIIDDEVEDPEDAAKMKTTFTGEKGDSKR
jgi:YteA family regulatory protein